MRVTFCVLLGILGMLLFGCNGNNDAVSESIVFSFEGRSYAGGGSFVCYPSRYGGWLCEAGTEDGNYKGAMRIEAETDSLRALFELVKNAESAVTARERAVEHDTVSSDGEEHTEEPLPAPSPKKIVVIYFENGKRVDVRVIEGYQNVTRLLRQEPHVKRVYKETLDSLGLPKMYWFRSLAPTMEDIRNGEWQLVPSKPQTP